MKNISKALILSILALTMNLANAQEHNEQVTVEGSYRPQIRRPERLVMSPGAPTNNFSIPDYKASTQEFDCRYGIELETMSALPYMPTTDSDIKGNLLKAALGTRLSPVFSYHHYSDLSKTMSLKVGLDHYSTWLSQKDYSKSSFMNNGVNIVTTNKFKSGQLDIYGNYHYDLYHLRAHDTLGKSVENPNGRNIHSVVAGAKWTAAGTSYRQLYQEFSGDYHRTEIMGGTNETQVNLNAHIAYSDSWIGTRSIENLQTFNLDVNMNYDYIYNGLLLFGARPNFTMNGDFYRLKIGLNIDVKTEENVNFYPDVRGSFLLFDKDLELFVKLAGQSKINTFETVVKENPFVTTDFTYLSNFGYEKTLFDFNFGGKLNILNVLDFYLGARYRIIEGGLFYIPDRTFHALYDNDDAVYHLQAFDVTFMDYNLWNFMFDVNWKISRAADASLAMSFNNFSISRAWYKPSFELTLKGGYRSSDTWKFNAAMHVMGRRWALDENNEETELKPAFDIQLGADYQINKDFSAFAEIHNLFHNKYQLYYNYPSLGFECFIGLKYKF